MSDRAARLEELRKATNERTVDSLEKCKSLNIMAKKLTCVPSGVCDLTGLTGLRFNENRLSSLPPEISRLKNLKELFVYNERLVSLPPEISRLTSLVYLYVCNNRLSSLPLELSHLTALTGMNVSGNRLSSLPLEMSRLKNIEWFEIYNNPIEELPLNITALTKLKRLCISDEDGKVNIKRAPRGITNLPCWNNVDKSYGMAISVADALRKLQLYDLVDTEVEARGYEDTQKGDSDSELVVGDYADVMSVDFETLPVTGKGNLGTVFKARLEKGVVAIKVLKLEVRPKTAEYEKLTKEVKRMVNLRHENIIGLLAYGCKRRHVFYVSEYADGKSIWNMIESFGPLPIGKFIQYSIQIITGLKYLHSHRPPIGHHDLRPENILLCGDIVKLCDFGISLARKTISCATAFQGTCHYAAPECLSAVKGYVTMSDIYCFGLVIWAMVEGKRPYDGLPFSQICTKKQQGELPTITVATPTKIASLMSECWVFEPHNRPSAVDLEISLVGIQRNPGLAQSEKVNL